MLTRLRRKPTGLPPDPDSINYSREHVSVAKTVARRRRIMGIVSRHLQTVRYALLLVSLLWILALPCEGLWKDTYMDEHAVSPAQVNMKYDWSDVHRADRYLDELERLISVNASQFERSTFLQDAFAAAGHTTGMTSSSTWAHISPPRSAGTETILVAANWVSRDNGPNLRGIATLLSLAAFLRGQTWWAFDFVFVVGEGYVAGLEGFMQEYNTLFSGRIWTALNLDYPGHSFSHIGLFYEGVNGRLPNQDIVNAASTVARWSVGSPVRLHDIPDEVPRYGPAWLEEPLGNYLLGGQHLVHHFWYAALGRPSGAHGVLARHRIDSVTLYCTPASGPHGFHTLGRAVESTLRSMNNLLERLHASYFFYLLPKHGKFLPVGHYLPAIVLLGASITLGGFDCPAPLQGVAWFLPAFAIAGLGWLAQAPWLALIGLALPKPAGKARKSMSALLHLLYGAYIPTLGMVNFPQATLLGALAAVYVFPPTWIRRAVLGASLGLWWALQVSEVKTEWTEVGNLAWPGLFVVWMPLWIGTAMLS